MGRAAAKRNLSINSRSSRHGNTTSKRAAHAPPVISSPQPSSSSPASSSTSPSVSSPSLASPAFSAAQMASNNRRMSFEDFATLDSVIAGILQKAHQMTTILQNAGSGNACSSTSSIEQAVFLSSTFESIKPFIFQMREDLDQGIMMFTPPPVPDLALLTETAEKLVEIGEMALTRLLASNNNEEPRDWYVLNTRWRIFSLSDRQVMAYMRCLSNQVPSALPIFPRHLHSANTYVMMGDSGAYFIGDEFVCRAPIPDGMTRRVTHPAGEQPPANKNSTFWYEASDTDEESTDATD